MRGLRSRRTPLAPKVAVLPMLDCEQDAPAPDWHLDHGGTRESWLDVWLERQERRERAWRETVCRFENDPGQFALAWAYLRDHPMFWCFDGDGLPPESRLHEQYLRAGDGVARCVGMYVWRERKRRGNPLTVVELDAGKWPWLRAMTPGAPGEGRCVDPRLTVRAPTVEEAFVQLAARVHGVYGNDRRACGDPLMFEPATNQE